MRSRDSLRRQFTAPVSSRERDHYGGHNPFSDNPPMEVLSGKASAGLSSEVEAQEAAQAEENEAGEIRCESDM